MENLEEKVEGLLYVCPPHVLALGDSGKCKFKLSEGLVRDGNLRSRGSGDSKGELAAMTVAVTAC